MKLGIMMALGSSLEDQAKSGQDSRFITYYLKPYGERFESVSLYSYGKEARKDLPSHVAVLPNRRGVHRALYALLLPFAWAKDLRERDAVRVMQMTGAIPATIAWKLFGVPFAATFGYRYSDLALQNGKRGTAALLKRIETIGLKHASKIIITSGAVEKYLVEERGADASKMIRIPNGVDCSAFTPVTHRPEAKRILSVGRLEDEKNYDAIIEAIALLPGKKPSITLIGKGSKQEELKDLARKLGVDLTIKPTLPYSEIAAEYHKADIFVLPSLSEGQPKVLIEAMGCSLPCIASPCDGNKQLVADKKTGMLASGFEAADFIEPLQALLGNLDLRASLGTAAREFILGTHDIKKNVAREIEMLIELGATKKKKSSRGPARLA